MVFLGKDASMLRKGAKSTLYFSQRSKSYVHKVHIIKMVAEETSELGEARVTNCKKKLRL